jgi:hypothetical protein
MIRRLVFCAVALSALAGLAFSQTWKGEVGIVGGLTDQNIFSAGSSVGVDGAGRIYKTIAIAGRYVHNSFPPFCFFGPCSVDNFVIHEFMGGLRVAANGDGIVSPYATLELGGTHFTNPSAASDTQFAWSPGGGVAFTIKHRVGLKFDLQGIKPANSDWYGRIAGGFYIRF